MKNSIKVTSLTLFLLLSGTCGLRAQEITQVSKSKALKFNNETQPVEIIIEVTNEFNYLNLAIAGQLDYGQATFEILDPKGKSKGKFTIETDNQKYGESTTTTSTAQGNMVKKFRNPSQGKWKIRITPKDKIIGNAHIRYNQVFNPKADLLEIDEIDPEKELKDIKEK